MSFELHHPFVSERFTPVRRTSGDETFFAVSKEGRFAVLYPGRVRKRVSATFTHRFRVSDPEGPETIDGRPRPGSHPLHGGFESVTMNIPLQLRIFTPDGREFTATEVTLADLRKFRDLRGTPSGLWSYKLSGESQHFVLSDEDGSITNAKGGIGIGVDETVRSESAPPLVPNAPVGLLSQSFSVDLFRVGVFVAELSHASPFASWRGTMRLIDPDGAVVARTSARTLRFPVSLATLGKSRDSAGKVRKWKLEVSPQVGFGDGSFRISATVIGSARLNTALLKGRIDRMIGPRGRFIKLFGENTGGEALARLIITDTVAAETIDMHDLLEKPLKGTPQDGNADPDNVQPDTLYTLGRRTEKLRFGATLEVKTLKVGAIDFAIGPGVRLGASVPAVRLTVEVSGKAKIKLGPATIAEAGVRGGRLEMEVGIKLGPDGTPQIVTSTPMSRSMSISTGVWCLAWASSPHRSSRSGARQRPNTSNMCSTRRSPRARASCLPTRPLHRPS